MIELTRTTSDDKRFKNLILELDNDLMTRYNQAEYKFDANIQLNALNTAIVAQITNITVGCGCFKEIDSTTIEIKRMYVNPYFRGFGVASLMIDALTKWGKELFYDNAVLETGTKQPESIKLYEKHGFVKIPPFEPYINIPDSICMSKAL